MKLVATKVSIGNLLPNEKMEWVREYIELEFDLIKQMTPDTITDDDIGPVWRVEYYKDPEDEWPYVYYILPEYKIVK